MRLNPALPALALLTAPCAPASGLAPAHVAHSGAEWTLSNGFVQATFTTGRLLHPGAALSSLKGDFQGAGAYGEELLSGAGYKLEAVAPDGVVASASSNDAPSSVKIVSSGPATAAILVSGIRAGGATETWSLSLAAGSRSLSLNTTGTMTGLNADGSVAEATLVRHVLSASPLGVYGYYPADGVVQMMNAGIGKRYMPSARPLERVYMMGGVNPSNTHPKPSQGTQGAIDIVRQVMRAHQM